MQGECDFHKGTPQLRVSNSTCQLCPLQLSYPERGTEALQAKQVQSLVPSAPAGLRHKGKSQMAGLGPLPKAPRLRSQARAALLLMAPDTFPLAQG